MVLKLENIAYKARIVDEEIERYLKTFGAVCIEGPKWCGKTWTSLYHSKSSFFVGDPSNSFQNRNLAKMAPNIILEGENPRLIDEWQEVPALWDAVRIKVDESNSKGKYILTGSTTPNRKGVLHSGAGRIGKLRMRTMSLFESGDSSGKVSLKDICRGEFKDVLTGDVDLRNLINYSVRGGWPGNLYVPEENMYLLPDSYIKAIVDNDLENFISGKINTRKVELILMSLARNESTTVSINRIKKDIIEYENENIDEDTIAKYLDIIDRLFLTDNQKPFAMNLRSSTRIKQAEKRHFCDPSLACALLKASPQMLLGDLQTFGSIFEALCERDLKIYAQSFGAKLYHYQDYKNREIDAVIEMNDGKWCAVEIKLGTNQIEDAVKNLLTIKKEIEKDGGVIPSSMCVICGMSNAAYLHPSGVYIVPITALKN